MLTSSKINLCFLCMECCANADFGDLLFTYDWCSFIRSLSFIFVCHRYRLPHSHGTSYITLHASSVGILVLVLLKLFLKGFWKFLFNCWESKKISGKGSIYHEFPIFLRENHINEFKWRIFIDGWNIEPVCRFSLWKNSFIRQSF